MEQADKLFTGAIPDLYHRLLGPLLFEPFAAELAGRLGPVAGPVLETAAGTGILTRALDRSLPAAATITATDLNQAMLDHGAASLVSSRIVWRQADALHLPFPDASFAAVLCQFGAMFFPDRVAAFAEARRVLRPGGVLLIAVWDRLAANPVPAAVAEAVAACLPDDPPDFLARVPYGYHDRGRVAADVGQGGLAVTAADTVALVGRADSSRDAAFGFCLGSPLRHEIEARAPGRVQAVAEQVAEALVARFGDGPLTAAAQAHLVIARCPAA